MVFRLKRRNGDIWATYDIYEKLPKYAERMLYLCTWNSMEWSFSNYDIFRTFTESSEVYRFAAEALGRGFFILERNKDTTKEEFIALGGIFSKIYNWDKRKL